MGVSTRITVFLLKNIHPCLRHMLPYIRTTHNLDMITCSIFSTHTCTHKHMACYLLIHFNVGSENENFNWPKNRNRPVFSDYRHQLLLNVLTRRQIWRPGSRALWFKLYQCLQMALHVNKCMWLAILFGVSLPYGQSFHMESNLSRPKFILSIYKACIKHLTLFKRSDLNHLHI